jgi:hypothetical protein
VLPDQTPSPQVKWPNDMIGHSRLLQQNRPKADMQSPPSRELLSIAASCRIEHPRPTHAGWAAPVAGVSMKRVPKRSIPLVLAQGLSVHVRFAAKSGP